NSTLLLVLVVLGLVIAAAAATALVAWGLVAILAARVRRRAPENYGDHDVAYSNSLFELGEVRSRESEAVQIDQ
ncbi:MAG: hypothetical protein ABI137_07255, partial [Antricoccus sp.]